jgi:Tfp pilus assembly protein PilF
MALVYMSRSDEGIAEIQKAIQISPEADVPRLRLALAYGLANRRTEAESLLREAEEASRHRYVPGMIISMIYAVLGENDLAFESLNRAVQEGGSTLDVLTEPVFDSLRTHPRFHGILEKIGLV